MKKRLISILLSLSMVLTLLPATVLSAGVDTSKAGDATFTLSASSASCADGHTGELRSIQVTGVDISKWKSDKRITIQYDVQYRCTDSSCELYDSDDSFFSYSGKHTFVDTNGEFCHKKISESFTATIPTELTSGATKNFSISFALTSDKGIYESVLHEQNVNLCTANYYNPRCWECTGCGYFFLHADMSGNKFTKDKVYFPPAGHDLKNIPAKDPTCVAKGTVEHWHCERCNRNFGDEQGTSELTTIETNAPLAAHRYDANGACEVCNREAAAGIQANAGMVWYDTMGKALTALTDGARLAINADYADTITLNQTCTVEVKAGVTAADIRIENVENCVVTIVNNGIISSLSGYTGKVVLMSAGGTYGKVINQTSGGNVGSFLYSDPEDANKFCYYKNLSNGKWILPAEATANTLSNVKVSYAPMAYIEIAGDGVTGSEGSYALTTSSGNTAAFTATAKTADGEDSANVAYKWYYDGQDDTILYEKAELTIENIKAGNRTVVCMATTDDYGISAKLVITVTGEKESQSFTLSVSKTTVGIREKILPLLSVEGIKEDAAITYYLMNGDSPAPESDTVIDENFAFAQTGTGSIYAYAAETDNYAASASAPVSITVTPHANHCICGGMFNHTHENVEWQAWDGKSEIQYEQKLVQVSEYTKQGRYVAYVYLTGNVSANLTVAPKHILYLCLNGYSFTCADPSQPAITLTGEDGKPVELDLCDCVGTGTLGGSNASGGSIRIGAYANATLYSGTLTGNNVSGDGGAVSVTGGNCSFTMHGGTITGNTATGNGGGISSYDSWNAGTVNINGGVISNNRATNGGGIYAASRTHFHLNGGEIINNTATGDGGGVYCSRLYSNADGRCEFNGSTISGNTAQRGGGAYVSVCFIGYRNCRITGNTATEAGGGLYLVPFASEKIIYMGRVYGGGGEIAPYIYDNTVNSAQNNLYLSDPDTQIQFTARINTDADAKLGVYFTGITSNGASVLLDYLQINSESRAKPYHERIFCDNPDYGRLEIQQDGEYYNLYLINTGDEVTITFDPNGGTLNAGEESKLVQPDSPYGTLPTPTRAGYRFDGWFTAIDGGEKVEETTVMSSRAAHTLYAHWTPIHVHAYTQQVQKPEALKTPADCTNNAVYYLSCACGEVSTNDSDTFIAANTALDHDWGAWTQNSDEKTHTRICKRDTSHTETENCHGGTATCTAKAVCTVCGGEYGEMVAHSFTEETAAEQYLKSAATCTKKAVYYKSCAVCGLSSDGTAEEATFFSGNILDHDWGAWTQNSDEKTHTRICKRDTSHTETENCHGGTATCTAKAVCTVCGGEYGEMVAHSFTEETAAEQYLKSAATCTKKAVYYKSCAVCGLSSEGTADEATFFSGNVLGHDLPNDWSKDENEHWHECKRCHNKEDKREHEYGDDNICDICGYDKTVPHTHNLTLVSANAATCIKDGNKAYYTCDGCDMWFEDANGSIEITNKTAVIIPATGHAPSESWKFDKADHWKDCTNAGCGVIIESSKAAHTESGWIIDTAPTYFNSGTQHKECTVCHYVTAVGFIPAKGGDIEPSDPSGWTPNPNLPATGGDNTAFIWIALLLICASTTAGTVIHGRRKKQR